MHQFGWLSEGVIFPSERGANLLQKEGVPRKGRCSLRKKGKGVPILEETMPHGNSLGHIMYGLYDIHDTHTYIYANILHSLYLYLYQSVHLPLSAEGGLLVKRG